MKNRFKYAISGENAGPMVESIVAICVALLVMVALGGLGALLMWWVSKSTGSVISLGTGPT